tara:strand:- start:1144 stop:1338 length:195 start_codon:yes stop_codon:yes gene_type:complete
MIKTNKEVIHLIHGLIALSQCDKLGEHDKVQDAINRTKDELTDHEILIAHYAYEALMVIYKNVN